MNSLNSILLIDIPINLRSAYLSPCFKFTKRFGNSCLHALPNIPVSSSPANLWLDLSALPAKKS